MARGLTPRRPTGLGGTRLVVLSWKPERLGDGCRARGTKEDRKHNGTVGRKRLLRQLEQLRRTVPDQGLPRAGQQLEEGTYPIRVLWELRSAGLLTAGPGAREGPNDHGHPHHHGEQG
jgi:hypothetical protein